MDIDNTKQSFLVPFVKSVINLCCLLSPYQIATRLLWNHHENIPFWFAEAYVLGRLVIVSIAFLLLRDPSGRAYSILSYIAVFSLIDLLAGTARIFFIEREDRLDEEGRHFILVRDVSRWIILTFLNLAEITLYFAVLYLKIGTQFSPAIIDRLTALYQSLLTFTTLGYGEIHPLEASIWSKVLVMCHLIYFIIFVFLVIPIVFSAVRVREHTTEVFGVTGKTEMNTQQTAKSDSGKGTALPGTPEQ